MAPYGALIFSMVSEKIPNFSPAVATYADETKGITKRIDLYLEALDNVKPQNFVKFGRENGHKIDPKDVIPHTIGIGGYPPILLNLDNEVNALVEKGKNGTLNRKFFDNAVKNVRERFDASDLNAYHESLTFNWNMLRPPFPT
jgi:hypothetical protein